MRADHTSVRVSVIVMTHNRPESLRRCLASLAAQTLAADTIEVVVVDVSTPPISEISRPIAGALRLVYHAAPNQGVAGNRNTGVARASAPIVAFLDDDCVAEPSWLEHLTEVVEAHPRTLAGGRVENPHPGNAFAAAGQVITEAVDAFFNPPGTPPQFLPGLNFALSRAGYVAIDGCDPNFGRLAAEDRDFIDRWRIAGGTLTCCANAVVRHEHRTTLGGFIRQYFNYGRGAWRYHQLRRQRASGRMAQDAGLHLRLPLFLRKPLARHGIGMQVRVIALLAVWQLANLAGFVWQAALDGRRGTRPPSQGLTRF